MPEAGELLRLYSLRLRMNRDGTTRWPVELREGVEGFVEKLKSLAADETVFVAARDDVARFVRASNGELLWEHKWRSGDGLAGEAGP